MAQHSTLLQCEVIYCDLLRYHWSTHSKLVYFGIGNALFLGAAGVVYFLYAGHGVLYLGFGFLAAAWFCWFASRPVQVGLLNDLIRDGDNRAFANSMTMPLGAATFALLALFMIAGQQLGGTSWFSPETTPNQDRASGSALTAQAIAVLFIVVGTLTALVTAVNCAKLSSSMAASDESATP